MIPSPVNWFTVPPYRFTTFAERPTKSDMISRKRSAPNAAAMCIDRTTSANNTVTCLYSAASYNAAMGVPQLSQNLAPSRSSVPHDAQVGDAAVIPPPLFRGLTAGHGRTWSH